MDSVEWTVIVACLFAVLLVLWWFFGERESAIARTSDVETMQEVDVLVRGGYTPDRILVKRGKPVRLNFRREETSSCSEQVLLPEFHIARDLPAFKTTSIEFTPEHTGEFSFTCGMNMIRARISVQD